MGPATEDVKAFLRTYFNPDYNGITREEVRRSQELRRLIEPLLGEEIQPTVLPWRNPEEESQGVDYWFALARSSSELYNLRSELQAFVGTTYARIEGGRRRPSKNTPFAEAIRHMTNGYVLPFKGWDGAVLQGLLRWLEVRAARPDRDIPESRSTGLLLRDFDAALQTQDRERARSVLTFLRSDHRLGAHNLQFLEVKLFAALQEWGPLLRHAQSKGLLRLRRRPSVVTDALLRALYYVHLREASREGDLDTLEKVLDDLASTMDALWTRRTGLQSREAWLTYGLAVGLVEGDYDGTQAAHQAITERGGEVALLAHLLERLEPVDLPEDPRVAFAQRDYDRVLELARTMEKGPGRAGLLVLLSRELDTLEVQQMAWEAATGLTDEGVESLSAIERDALERLEDEMTPVEAQVTGWLDLFEAVQGGALSHAQVLRLAQEGYAEWTLDSLVSEPDALVEVLLTVPDPQEATLQDILTYVVDVLQQDPSYPDPALREVYDLLLLLLLDTKYPQPDTFYNVVDLLPGVLGGLSEEKYTEAIEDIIELLDRTSARIPPSRLLDFIDLLVDSACPSPGARQACFAYADQHRQQNERHWSRSHWRFLRDIAEEIGLGELVPPVPSEESGAVDDPLAFLKGRYVGIYTLTASAGKRTAELLDQRVSDVEVQVSNAKVATQKLRAMAQNADVILMVTSSATHAATNTIMDHLGEKTKLVRPPGKGSSSMLSALEEVAPELGG